VWRWRQRQSLSGTQRSLSESVGSSRTGGEWARRAMRRIKLMAQAKRPEHAGDGLTHRVPVGHALLASDAQHGPATPLRTFLDRMGSLPQSRQGSLASNRSAGGSTVGGLFIHHHAAVLPFLDSDAWTQGDAAQRSLQESTEAPDLFVDIVRQSPTFDDSDESGEHSPRSVTSSEHDATTPHSRPARTALLPRMVAWSLGALLATSALQAVFLLAVWVGWGLGSDDDAYDMLVFVPPVFVLVLLVGLGAGWCADANWGDHRWRWVGAALLFVAPVALEGTVTGRRHTKTACLWAFLAVLIDCAACPLSSWAWIRSLSVYLVLLVAFAAWEKEAFEGGTLEAEGEVVWWREVLLGLNHLVASFMWTVPSLLAARLVIAEQRRAKELLVKTRMHVLRESQLLRALVPAAVTERLVRGDELISDHLLDGSVMFIYVCDYQRMVLQHGPIATIAWVNNLYQRMDSAIENRASPTLTKVETFNNFLLVYSGRPDAHAEECLDLALELLAATSAVRRPDRELSAVRIGVSSGEVSAGVIGHNSPRYSIFGDTVNTASRMAATAEPSTAKQPFLHLSPSARAAVSRDLALRLERVCGMRIWARGGGMEIKGKGTVQTYALTRIPADTVPPATEAPQLIGPPDTEPT